MKLSATTCTSHYQTKNMINIKAIFPLTLTFSILMFIQFANPTLSKDFIQCMGIINSKTIVYTKESTLYSSLFQKSQQNPRWVNSSSTLKPLCIVTPSQESEIQAVILCSKEHGLRVRIRSGGHDYEGLSYLSKTPYVLIDLINLRKITINAKDQTAWVQSGATLGELYYTIAKESNTFAFPAGVCPTVGVGGHISGGGFGALTRKFGLAADHVVDAHLVDANGRVLDRKLMGEEVFWAIRGGGGASFGVITAWKVKLVTVPITVTVFTVHKTLEQGGSMLIDQWQRIADKLPEDLFIRVIVQNMGGGSYGVKKTIQASFNSMFLGNIQSLIPLMNQAFPKLGLEAKDCKELPWIEAVLFFAGHPSGTPREVLLQRDHQLYKSYFKGKSDFVTQPIPENALQQAWERHFQVNEAYMIMEPLGGVMDRIPETRIPFPHRKGNLYNIQYIVKWKVNEDEEARRHIHWVRMLHNFMRPYVSKSPRSAYFNYRDLDLGINNEIRGNVNYEKAKVWGLKYFKGNFQRLAKAKRSIDPSNFFRDEQSIPPFG